MEKEKAQGSRKQNGTKKRKISLSTILLTAMFLVGLGLLCYPTFSDWWNSGTQSRAVADYNAAVADLSEEDYTLILEEAETYNQALYELGSAAALSNPDLLDEELAYDEILDITGTGIMGYITIEKINVELPVYHGTDANVLASGAGHLEGSSFPIGGENTHSVISAHRGLPSSLLFTKLDQMEIGDTFEITVLDELYTYEVDKISIILPTELENLYIEDGEDYCTLMTCTPYGINTHRLLVRGIRTENAKHIKVNADAWKIQPIVVAPFIAIPMLIALLIWVLVTTRKNKKNVYDKK